MGRMGAMGLLLQDHMVGHSNEGKWPPPKRHDTQSARISNLSFPRVAHHRFGWGAGNCPHGRNIRAEP